MSKVDDVYNLTPSDFSKYIDRIFIKLIRRDKPTRDNLAIIIYGTPGAGKTCGTKTFLKEKFGAKSKKRFLIIDRDELTFDYTYYFDRMNDFFKRNKIKDPNVINTKKFQNTKKSQEYINLLSQHLSQGNQIMFALLDKAIKENYNVILYDPPYNLRLSGADWPDPNSPEAYTFHLLYMYTPLEKVKKHLQSRNKKNYIVLSDKALRRLTINTLSDFTHFCLDKKDDISSCSVIDNSKSKSKMTVMKDWDFIYHFQSPQQPHPSNYQFINYQ